MKSKNLLLSLALLWGLFSWTAKADITKTVGATGSGADFATLKDAFDAINTNTGNAYVGAVTLQIIESTTETAAAQLNGGNKGVRSLGSIVGGSGFVAPKVSIVLTGAASVTTAGTLVTTVTNGMVTKIVMTGGSYTTSTGTITVAIDAPSAGGVTSTATVGTVTGANLSFTMTNGGSGYGPIATFSGGSPGSGAGLSVQIISPATVPGVTPTGVGLTVAAARPGSGYTSTPTISIPSGWGGSGASAVANLYTNYTSVNIYPTVTGKTITSSFNGNLIQLTGANNVTIDGRLRNSSGVLQAGDARDLTISNTTTSAANSANTIRFDGGASNNIVEYCNLKGSPNQDFQAIVIFGSAGNSNNTIDHNLITNYTDASRPQVSIYSGGATLDNANNTISNNEFANCMSTLLCSRAVRLVAFNSNWTISGNSFYETGTFAAASGVTGSNLNKTMIEIGASTGHTISGNYIGGSSAQCGGTLTKTGGYDNGFNGINATNSTNPGQANASTLYVQNNFIKNINWTNGTAATNAFNCIAIVGVGISATGNIVGDGSTGSISLTPTAGGSLYGFNISNSGGGTVDCSNNTIGSIVTTTNKANVYGIWSNVLINGVTTGTNTVTGNTIGNLTQSGSINASAAVVDNVVYGIRVANQGPNTVSGNTIANLVCASVTSSGGGGVFGIKIDNGTATVNGNYIIKLTTPNSAGGAIVKGISIDNTGIGVVATSTYSNNIISLGDNTTTSFYGISEVNAQGASTTNLYHNTIYLSGTHPAGAGAMSYALRSSNSTTYNKNFKNNIIFNARTGGTVTHYGLFATAPAAGGTFDCNYNDYFISGSNGKLGNYAGTDKTATPIVTGQTGNDANSYAGNPGFANASGATAESFVPSSLSITGVDLHATVPVDYNGVSRTTSPTMGAFDYMIWNGSAWNSSPNTNYNAKVDGTFNGAGFSCRNLVLNSGKQLSITSGTLAVANNFTINSDAANGTGTVIDNGGTLNVGGTTNVQQYLTTARNWYISSPVSGASSSVFNAAGASNINKLYSYDETNGSSLTLNWPQITNNSTSLAVTKGYVANVDTTLVVATKGVTFSGGTLNTGNITTGLNSVPVLTLTASQAFAGYNLVGNPYPSYLDWVAVSAAATNVDPSMWYRTKNGSVYEFDTYNATSGVGTNNATVVTQYIPPMQAFWVKVSSGTSGTLALTNAMRSHNDVSTNKFRIKEVSNANQSVLYLQVSNGVNSDEAIVLFNPNASNGLDAYDSQKMSNANAAIPEIYTTVSNENLVINGMTAIPYDTEIPLGFTTGQAGTNFSIKASQLSNFNAGTKVILKDYADVNNPLISDLSDGSTYVFSSNATTNNTNRFALLFHAPSITTGINPTDISSFWISTNANGQIIVNGNLSENSSVAIYNAIGQKIMSRNLTQANASLEISLQAGVYLVTLSNAGKSITRKVIID
ncbi:MAG: T9SS type A sorting domain-containing protein [Paludibacter sp.]